jgi:hypothetical protein
MPCSVARYSPVLTLWYMFQADSSLAELSHGLRERADVEDAFRRQRFDLRFAHCDDVNGIAHRVKNFQGVTRFLAHAARVVFDNSSHVPAAKPVLRQAGLQRYSAEHFVFHDLSKQGSFASAYSSRADPCLLGPQRLQANGALQSGQVFAGFDPVIHVPG